MGIVCTGHSFEVGYSVCERLFFGFGGIDFTGKISRYDTSLFLG